MIACALVVVMIELVGLFAFLMITRVDIGAQDKCIECLKRRLKGVGCGNGACCCPGIQGNGGGLKGERSSVTLLEALKRVKAKKGGK